MKINLNDCVLIGESNKIFDIMLAYNMYLDDQIECSCYNDAGKQANCTDIFVRDLKIVGNVLILICD